ncbi:hypothetical protein [Haloferax chudinovii]|uniref:Uncharacterized protein n=1 Tax=Haloferax chudinovii TaxID=1109010 RepID=A0ABD5XM55_9EURY
MRSETYSRVTGERHPSISLGNSLAGGGTTALSVKVVVTLLGEFVTVTPRSDPRANG